ncbi:MAG TPA: ABC transporter substrate-binding protein [Gammaproteobacteria bacterium]
MRRASSRFRVAVLAAGGLAVPVVAAQEPATACETPVGCVAALHAGLVAAVGDGAGDVHRRYEQIAPLVTATHDVGFIAEFSVRREWEGFDADARAAFIAAFSHLSAMTYATRFGSVGAETFAIDGSETQPSGRVSVAARIRRAPEPDIPLDYLLHETGDGWRIINVVADGVSDLALKRAEYRAVLDEGGVEALLEHLDEQIDAL